MASFRTSDEFEILNTTLNRLTLKAQDADEPQTIPARKSHQGGSAQDDDGSESSDDDEEDETIIMPLAKLGHSLRIPTSRYGSQEDTHPLLSAHPFIVQQVLLDFQSWNQHANNGGAESASGSSSSANSPTTASARTSPGLPTGAGHRGTKRKSDANANEEEDKDGSGQGGSNKRSQNHTSLGKSRRHLACPFAKKDPPKHRECYKIRITKIQYVKQHLRRYHEQPIHCLCCKDRFKSEAELRAHAEANRCSPRHEIIEGVDRDQKAKLDKPVPRTLSLEDQWFFIFDILFPGFEPRPRSPYVEGNLEATLSAFNDYLADEGMFVLMRILQANGLVTSSLRDDSQLILATLREGHDAIVDEWNSRLRANDPSPSASQADSAPGVVIPNTRMETGSHSHSNNNGGTLPAQATMAQVPRYFPHPEDDLSLTINEGAGHEGNTNFRLSSDRDEPLLARPGLLTDIANVHHVGAHESSFNIEQMWDLNSLFSPDVDQSAA